MAITEIVSDIAGVGPTANYTLGANTEAPYAGVSILGLTDGVSAATASKNMAEIDNRYLFERKLTIEKAGLAYDPLDDSQFVKALRLLPNISPASFATFPSVLRPTSAPSVADPAIVKTNTNGEVFMWNGTGWYLIGNGFEIVANGAVVIASTNPVLCTITAPRAGKAILSMEAIFQAGLPQTAYYWYFNYGPFFSRVVSANLPPSLYPTAVGSQKMTVTQGQVISLSVVSNHAQPVTWSSLSLTYI